MPMREKRKTLERIDMALAELGEATARAVAYVLDMSESYIYHLLKTAEKYNGRYLSRTIPTMRHGGRSLRFRLNKKKNDSTPKSR